MHIPSTLTSPDLCANSVLKGNNCLTKKIFLSVHFFSVDPPRWYPSRLGQHRTQMGAMKVSRKKRKGKSKQGVSRTSTTTIQEVVKEKNLSSRRRTKVWTQLAESSPVRCNLPSRWLLAPGVGGVQRGCSKGFRKEGVKELGSVRRNLPRAVCPPGAGCPRTSPKYENFDAGDILSVRCNLPRATPFGAGVG